MQLLPTNYDGTALLDKIVHIFISSSRSLNPYQYYKEMIFVCSFIGVKMSGTTEPILKIRSKIEFFLSICRIPRRFGWKK